MVWNIAGSRNRNPSECVAGRTTQIAWNGLVLPIAVLLICPVAAHAEPCSAEIARLESVLSQSQGVPSVPETVAARLHHQPTPETVREAETGARKRVDAALGLARKLDSEGKDSECIATLEKVGVR
jgi:hypothetical protein